MKLIFKFATFGLVGSSIIYGACSGLAANSIENRSERISHPTPTERSVRGTAWKTPSTKDTRSDKPGFETLRSANGKFVKVKINWFAPKNEVVYKEGPPPGVMPWVRGELRLIQFREFSVNGKIYLYDITAQNYVDKNQTNDHEEIYSYQIFDDDGDGAFETLVDGISTVLIPKWVTG